MEQDIINLLEKYMDKSCDEQELEQVLLIIEQGDYQEEWEAALSNDAVKIMQSDEKLINLDVEQTSVLNKRILHSINSKPTIIQLPRRRNIWLRISAAASILLIASLGLYFYGNRSANDKQNQITYENDIAPGKNGATLTLSNGQKILINDALTGKIATQSGVKISRTAKGQIIYEVTGNNLNEIAFNILSTNRGEQIQVHLPDGTLVFLNAESTLKYPTSFSKTNNRQVTLTGEGYFEVAKDKSHPFLVKTKNQQVEVLGTHFNIDSYSPQSSTNTTLVEGVIKVSSRNGTSKILKPNQQSILSSEGIVVKDVEAEYDIAWKEGFFMFNNESLQNIMDKISRWYNVKVVYEDETLKGRSFIGTINKFENISKVLNMLEKTNVAVFTINKDVLTIKRKNR